MIFPWEENFKSANCGNMKRLHVRNGKATCPSCGAVTGVSETLGLLDVHLLNGAGLCPAVQEKFELVTQTIRKRDHSAKASDKHQKAIRRFERRQQRMLRRTEESRHWRDEYAIACEDSWGNDNLGQEGGHNSVRAYSGGRTESNRQRF